MISFSKKRISRWKITELCASHRNTPTDHMEWCPIIVPVFLEYNSSQIVTFCLSLEKEQNKINDCRFSHFGPRISKSESRTKLDRAGLDRTRPDRTGLVRWRQTASLIDWTSSRPDCIGVHKLQTSAQTDSANFCCSCTKRNVTIMLLWPWQFFHPLVM